jgi:predicted permease
MRLLRATWYHLRALVRRSRADEELDLELRDHIERQTKANIARGLSPTDARREALVAFGGVERFREETRDTRALQWVDTTIQDLRYALRGLKRAPAFAAVAIATLGLGIGATTAVFTVVDRVLLRSLPFRQSDNLYALSYLPSDLPFAIAPGLLDRFYVPYHDRQRSFEQVAAYGRTEFTLSGSGDAARISGTFVAADFWPMLGVSPSRGRAFLSEETRPGSEHVVIVSDKLWRDRFSADEHMVGRSITLNGEPYLVVGVAPPGFSFPASSDLWAPLALRMEGNNAMFLSVVGRSRPGVTPAQARAELDAIGKAMPRGPRDPGHPKTASVISLKQLVTGDAERSLYLFAGAVAFVLLIAGVNVANLLLMRAAARRHEIALRVSLGASRGRLVRQLLTESVLIAGLGGVVGTALAFAGVRALLAAAPPGSIPRVGEVHLDARVLAFGFLASLACGVIFGIVPALDGARTDQRSALSQNLRTLSSPHGRLRSRFVMGEIALAFVLLTAAGLMIRSFARMRGIDTGYDASGVVTMAVELPKAGYPDAGRIRQFHTSVLERLARVPGARAVGAVSFRPMSEIGIMGDFAVENGTKLPEGSTVAKPTASPGYFGAMGIRLVRGRDFSPHDDASAPGSVIVSESVARLIWPNQDAIGKRISMANHPGPNDWLTVIGVAHDIVQDRALKPQPTIYLPYLQTDASSFISHMTFVVRTKPGASNVAPAMRAALHDVDPAIPAQSLQTMDTSMLDMIAEPLFQTRLLTTFSMLALLLAAIGTYGVLAYDVAERTREIGIRIALGAGAREVRTMIIGRTLWFALIGVALGAVGALAGTRLLSRFLFAVTPTDPTTFAATAALLVIAALTAGFVPALRATRVDPISALRQE